MKNAIRNIIIVLSLGCASYAIANNPSDNMNNAQNSNAQSQMQNNSNDMQNKNMQSPNNQNNMQAQKGSSRDMGKNPVNSSANSANSAQNQ